MYVCIVLLVVDPGQRDFPRLQSEWKFATRPAPAPPASVAPSLDATVLKHVASAHLSPGTSRNS